MYFHGDFLTQASETVTVHIVTGGSRTPAVEIGADGGSVFFTDNPVEIESSVNDTFDHLLRTRATIRLLTRSFIPELFCTSCRDAVVNIYKGEECVFAGFIDPQTYSQDYNELYDELELSCVDVLSALQYSKYANIGAAGVVYEDVRAAAAQRTFLELINATLGAACRGLALNAGATVQVFYDGSKALTATSDRYGIFSRLSISELLFLGSEEDDVWQQDKVLEELLKYLNLHVVQDGLRFYIFSWESVKGSEPITWKELTTGATMITARHVTEFSLSNVVGTDNTISIGEVYNQILLTCKTEGADSLIESPLDEDALKSPFSKRQKYITEYSAVADDKKAANAFYAMTHGRETTYEKGTITDWFMQVKNNPHWVFPESLTGANLIDKYCTEGKNQQTVPNLMPLQPCAAIVSLGKAETKTDHKDNAPVSKIDMENYFVVSVNGNGSDDAQTAYPTEESLKNAAPVAFYTGPTTASVYTPSDADTTNYIVLSGKIVLNPVMAFTNSYKELHNYEWGVDWLFFNTVPSRESKDGRFYTQKYWKAAHPTDIPVWDTDTDRGLVPFTDTGEQLYEFKYSAIGDGTDRISKVAVLACMLIVGDKCVVETGTAGQTSDFEWRTYKAPAECADVDEYYQQSFTIGFDPKIGDKLIGTEFSLQNNISYEMGIDAEGIAIPIKSDTRLSGPVKFIILGPVNTLWDEVTRRHKTWFRHTKWSSNSVPLLSHVSSIFLKSFEVKLYSDNGQLNTEDDNDLIYMSDTMETFVNRKDDISFEINSALTKEECLKLGVSDTVRLSVPLDFTTGAGLLSVYDHNKAAQAKPEQLYVDSYYTEYHRPRLIMKQKIDERAGVTGLFRHYRHPAMPDKLFYVQSISRSLIESYAELTIKEVWND